MIADWYQRTKLALYLKKQYAGTKRKGKQAADRYQTESDRIYVASYDGRYGCNPKYIVEEILRRKLPLKVVWGVPDDGRYRDTFPEQVDVVLQGSDDMYREMARAKFWIDNGISCTWYGMPRKKDQLYLDTFHGSMGIKKLYSWQLEADRKRRVTQPDFFLTNSVFEEDVFQNSYWPGVPHLPFGHARNDILSDPEQMKRIRQTILEKYALPAESRLFLYAPTFRDNGDEITYRLSFEKLREALAEKFGGEWTVLIRAHWRELDRIGGFETDAHMINVSAHPDMQELLCAADAGMTDYSSWAYDYVLTGRPLFLFAYDFDAYRDMRGLYYPLEETPFPVCRTEEDILRAVHSFGREAYAKDCRRFLEARGCYEDGHAAERTVDWIWENRQ